MFSRVMRIFYFDKTKQVFINMLEVFVTHITVFNELHALIMF